MDDCPTSNPAAGQDSICHSGKDDKLDGTSVGINVISRGSHGWHLFLRLDKISRGLADTHCLMFQIVLQKLFRAGMRKC